MAASSWIDLHTHMLPYLKFNMC